MAKRILIDAAHPEETRVVVTRGNKVEDFDYESAAHKRLRGNIYLAKVTRVEPSLQAAFIDYGGNRHGFLAFGEIHPDYYQIPQADRQALIDEERKSFSDEEETPDGGPEDAPENPDDGRDETEDDETRTETADADDDGNDPKIALLGIDGSGDDSIASDEIADAETDEDADETETRDGNGKKDGGTKPAGRSRRKRKPKVATEEKDPGDADDATSEDADETETRDGNGKKGGGTKPTGRSRRKRKSKTEAEEEDSGDADDGEDIESVGAKDALEEIPHRSPKRLREYKIQEVIKRRQLVLVQVVKEERGNKGAALTTYMSLAGRYCVLMPNTSRGGGISRKIADAKDRKRLKEVASGFVIPPGMGLIVRTAGADRTKAEIKRDFDFLTRLWESIRDLTLKSNAPCLVYEEGSLIKRSIRDLYDKDVDGVEIEGEAAYREAKDLMKMLMPSHVKNVRAYKDAQPLLSRNQIEAQLDALYSPQVTLPSGGYIVIDQTEALVAIDVNSGKATREHDIENTALKTNQEAAEEIARQMRLRDLAGLIVIDFIDMEERRNNRLVERKLKDALKNDRARIQVGRIGHFGLLEMSRQRMRTGVLESSTLVCPHCEGRGFVRSVESCALSVLRGTEDHLMRRRNPGNVVVNCESDVAHYILNQKRDHLHALEAAFSVVVFVGPDKDLRGSDFRIGKTGKPTRQPGAAAAVSLSKAYEAAEDDEDVDREVAVRDEAEADEERSGRRRRRRGRRGRGAKNRERTENDATADVPTESDADAEIVEAADNDGSEETEGDGKRRRRRRSRRGDGEKSRENEGSPEDEDSATDGKIEASRDAASETDEPLAPEDRPEAEAEDKPRRRGRPRKKTETAPDETADASADKAEEPDGKRKAPAKRGSRGKVGETAAAETEAQTGGTSNETGSEVGSGTEESAESDHGTVAVPEAEPAPSSSPPNDSPRSGWWQK